MSVRSCRVTIRDTQGIEHTAEVSAESLYEAVALGLRAIGQCSWVEDVGQNFTIRVLARDTPVGHTVEFRTFHKWLEQRGRSPREITARARIREILDLKLGSSQGIEKLERASCDAVRTASPTYGSKNTFKR